jgi:hypothetical protein
MDGFDPDAYLSGVQDPVEPAPLPGADAFDPDAYLRRKQPSSAVTVAELPVTSTRDPIRFDPDRYLVSTPAASPAPVTTAVTPPPVAAVAPPQSSTPAPAAPAAATTPDKPENQMWWWERAARGVAGGFTSAIGRLTKSPAGQVLSYHASEEPGSEFFPATEAALEAQDPEALARKQGAQLEQTGKQITESAPPGFARGAGEVAGGIVPFIAGEAIGGPALMLPMLFADGYQSHKDAAEAKGEDGTGAALAGGALNLALGLPVFKVVKGVARAIVPDVAGTVQTTIKTLYDKAGIPAVEKLIAALESRGAQEDWNPEATKGLFAALKQLDAEIKAPVTKALQHVLRQSAESAATGGAVTTGHNLIAQNSYDPDRPTFQGVPEALATFGALGAIGATGEAVGKIRNARAAQDYLRQRFQEPTAARTVPELPTSPPSSEPPRPTETSNPPPAPAPPPAVARDTSISSASPSPQPPMISYVPQGPEVSRSSVTASAAQFPELNAPESIRVAGADVVQVPTSHIALRPELMQFKSIDDRATGTNENDKITAKYDPIKADNLLVWEPQDPAAYGLSAGQRYIAADGHHRHTAAVEQGIDRQNVQILRESAGFSANDARTLAAEKNIAGGKGTIYDQAKFIRNVAATHGPDAALERAGQIGARGRKAATIALAAEPDLYASFINEQVTPEAAAAIANVAPRDAGLQRLGIQRALQGEDPELIANFLQAVRAQTGSRQPTAEQVDLFAADDAAIKAAEKAARRARAIQREIGDQIASVAGASRRPEKAKALGVDVKDPEAVAAKLVELQNLRDRARNWALDNSIRDLAMGGEATAAEAVKKLQTAATGPAAKPFDPEEYLGGKVAEEPPELHQLGPEAGITNPREGRWRAIENSYIMAKAASDALPGVPLKDIFALHIYDKTQGRPGAHPEVAVRYVERSKYPAFQRALETEFPAARYATAVQSNHEPYQPRKGEPSYKQWLAGARPDTEALLAAEQKKYAAAKKEDPQLRLFELPDVRYDVDTIKRLQLALESGQLPAKNAAEARAERDLQLRQLRNLARMESAQGEMVFGSGVEPGMDLETAAAFAMADDPKIHTWAAALRQGRILLENAREAEEEANREAAQNYVADHDIPSDKRQEAINGIARTLSLATDPRLARSYEGNQALLFHGGSETLAQKSAQAAARGAKAAATRRANQLEREVTSHRLGLSALRGNDPERLNRALAENKNRVSTIIPRLVGGNTPTWNIVGSVIKTPADMMMAVQTTRSPYVESLKVAVTDRNGKVLASEIVSIGSLNESIAHPREIFRLAAILQDEHPGLGMILSHNHPSGDPSPSQSDVSLQRRMDEVSALLKIPLLDHVITNGKKFYSFKTGAGELPERILQPWEVVPGEEMPVLDSPDQVKQYALALRSGNPAAAHVFYLSTRYNIKAVERVLPADSGYHVGSALARAAMRGASREGAYAVIVDLPGGEANNASLLRQLQTGLADLYQVKVLDATWPGMHSAREAGLLNEEPGTYGAGGRVREDQPDFFEDQLRQAERKTRGSKRKYPLTGWEIMQQRLKPKQADLFAGKPDDAFNLAGEKGIDWAARQAEIEAAARRDEEARAIANQRQIRIPGIEGSTAPPITGHELMAPAAPTAPADDPTFTALPVDLPEAVRFAKDLLGVAIQVRRKLGNWAGVFRHTDGPAGHGEIHLRADIADLLTPEQKAELIQQAADYAERVSDNPAEQAGIAQARYEFLLDQAYQEAKTKPPVLALKVIWHEIGHAVDWLPEKLISGRGNLFGHIANLKRYLKHTLALDPEEPAGKPIDRRQRDAMFKEAERQLRDEFGPIAEIVETVIVEEPELRIVGVTPTDVRNLFGMDARETLPELYKWFAEQTAEVKKEIVRKAMRDVLDERLAALGKTEQVGVKRTKRTVRKKVGREPSLAEITTRFRRIFREELRQRNLAQLEQVKEELRSAIAWWHGLEKMPAYFKTGTEMYAEAFSIFLNNPAALQKRAPTAARLFWNYMAARPEVGALYDAIQNKIKAVQAEDDTEQTMLDSWDAADAKGLENAKPERATLRDFLDNVSYHMDRRMGPIYRAAKGSPLEPQVRAAIGNFLYRASEHELFLNRMNRLVGRPLVEANLDWKDLGRYQFYTRIVNERFKIFNPYGIAPDRALKRLAKMQQTFGPNRWQALQDAAGAFRKLYEEHVITAMQEARLWSPELQELINRNVDYATFAVEQDQPADGIASLLASAYGANIGPHIYRQIGTVREIKNPATATVLKSLSLISAAARNIAKRETVRMLLQNDPQNIAEAEKRWTGKRWEFIPRENNHVGTVVYLELGKPRAFYVRKVVAEALNKGNAIDNRLVLLAVKATGILKGLFTQLNYAFWPVNFVRDSFGWIIQMPEAGPIGWAREFPKALVAARASVKGTRNPAAEDALKRRMLISRADPQGVWSAVDNEFELKLASYGLDPAMWDHEANRVHSLVRIWNSYRELGQAGERVNKIAAMLYLDRHFPDMPEWKKREIVRERGGSPDFLQRGASNPYIDFFMMFYNPWKEGVRSVAKSARENPWSFGAKAMALIIVPAVLQVLAAAGVFGDGRRRMYRSIPDYDLTNYICVPIGWQDEAQRKVAYFRFPLWEPGRIIHGTLWQLLTGRGSGLGSFYGGTMPGMNSLLNVARMWTEYEIFGHNPIDSFRGKNILSDTQFQAAGWQARQELLKQSWNNLGGAIVNRFQNPQLESPPQTETEKFLNLPIVNNFLGRWVKVSNRGLDDEDRHLTAPIQQQRAQTRLAVQGITRKLIDGEGLTTPEKRILWDPYAIEYLRRTLPEVVTARSSPLLRRIQGKTPAEKAAILEAAIHE